MYIEQLYTGCLSEAAYYVESNGEVAVIDPLRDIQPYLDLAEKRKAKVIYVFETHFHADFVSGHIDLAKRTNAPIIFGPEAKTSYKILNAKEGEKFQLGKVTIEVIHTPGHTPESSCYLLRDENNKPHALFTGDTVFVGDVGRPDLLDGITSKEELAGWMYESLQKIKKLPDEVIIYPAHGPGSACGKNLGPETYSTIGQQKKFNYALQEMPKEEFIKTVTAGLMPPPPYFAIDAAINKKGYSSLEDILGRSNRALSIEQFEQEITGGAIILDTRHPDEFEKGFIPQSFSIGLNGRFAEWVGTLLDINVPIVLVTENGKESESIIRMARVGYENVRGYLDGSIESWKSAQKPIDMVISIDADEFALDIKHDGDIVVIDVRKQNEYEAGHVKNAINLPLHKLVHQMGQLNKTDKMYVHCAGGYRSMIAASILKQYGYHNFHNILGGYTKMVKQSAIPLVKPVLSSTTL